MLPVRKRDSRNRVRRSDPDRYEGDATMKTQRILAIAAAMALSFAAHAHDCSGGASGGMDATGNQCSDEATVEAFEAASVAASAVPTHVAAPSTQSCDAHAIRSVSTKTAHAKHRHNDATKSVHTAAG
jgi:hypothetical protein